MVLKISIKKISVFTSKIFKWAKKKKFAAAIIIVLIATIAYSGIKAISGNKSETRYAVSAAKKDTLIVSVSGSGQVSASDQIDIKPKASGEIIYLNAKVGDSIWPGELLLKINDSDAQKTVRDTEIAFEKSKLDLQKMKGLESEIGMIRGIKEKAEDNLNKSYEDGFNNVANVFLELPGIMSGVSNIIFSYDLNPLQWNIDCYSNAAETYDGTGKAQIYRDNVYNSYQTARASYDHNFQDYKSTNRSSEKEEIEVLIEKTYETVKKIAELIKNSNNLIQFYQDKLTERNAVPQAISNNHLSSLSSYTGKTNSFLLNLLSTKNTIQTNKETFIETDFDIADQEIQTRKAEETFNDARDKLADYSIYSPFSGLVAKVNVKKNDSVSSGSAILTLITKQKLAEITLNEIDVAKIKLGQKTNINFDAIENLNVTGKVIEIDTVGETSQGVVTYGVKISFDSQDERIKSGMSVSVSIITDVRQSAILIPNSAIKQQNSASYVQIAKKSENISSADLSFQEVEIGISNDTMTEIISGIKEGDLIVTQTVSQASIQNSGQSSNFRFNSGPSSGGEMMRIIR